MRLDSALRVVLGLMEFDLPGSILAEYRIVPAGVTARLDCRVYIDLRAYEGQAPRSIEVERVPTPEEIDSLRYAAEQMLADAWEEPACTGLAIETAGMGVG